jgi:hypothetical protein
LHVTFALNSQHSLEGRLLGSSRGVAMEGSFAPDKLT